MSKRRRILLTGASGGLGSALQQAWKTRHEVLGLYYSHPVPEALQADLTQPEPILQLAQDFQPDIIMHTVGLTDVDLCDRDLSLALDINTRSTLHARLAAEAVGAKMIHVSTNDVFDGEAGMFHEEQRPRPINMYSHTKYMAETMLYGYANSLILRFTILSWYAAGKTTFARWICDSLRAQQEITLYTNQYNSPVYISTLAEWIEALFDVQGIYHLGSQRHSRWETGLAIAQAMGLNTDLVQQGLVQQNSFSAPRPLDVSLDCSKALRDHGLQSTLKQEVERLVADCPADLRSLME